MGFRTLIKTITKSEINSIHDPSKSMGKVKCHKAIISILDPDPCQTDQSELEFTEPIWTRNSVQIRVKN